MVLNIAHTKVDMYFGGMDKALGSTGGFCVGNKEIIRHHSKRMSSIVDAVNDGAQTVEDIAGKVFVARKLVGGGIFAAVNEVVSHLEFLIDSGDVVVSPSGNVSGNRTSNFKNSLDQLISKPEIPIR